MAKATKVTKTAVAKARRVLQDDVLVVQDDIKLDLSISMDNLAEMVATDARTAMLQVRHDIQSKLSAAKAVFSDMEGQLQKQASEAIKDACEDDSATALMNAMTAFTGRPFKVTTGDATVNVESQTISVTIAVSDREGYQPYYSSSCQVAKSVQRPFTTAMRDLVDQLRKQTEKINAIQKELDKLHNQISDLPNLVSRAKSSLMKAYLRKQLVTGTDMLNVLESVQAIALPALPAPDRQ